MTRSHPRPRLSYSANMTNGDTDQNSAASALSLVSEADVYSREAWESATAALLRRSGKLTESDPDAAAWDVLTRATLDGIAVPPIGTPDDAVVHAPPGAAPFTRGRVSARPDEGWGIRPHFSGPNARAVNESALVELNNGATSLWLEFTSALSSSELETILDGVFVDLAPITLDAPVDPKGAADALAALLDKRALAPCEGTNLGGDPVGARIRGFAQQGSDDDVIAHLVRVAADNDCLALAVDGTAVHDLGATDAQELGYSLAVGAAYLRAIVKTGLDVDEALSFLEFRYAATDEQFPTIAKFRAARQLWARVAELSGVTDRHAAQRQHAVTSRPMMTSYDPWVNMLRTTIAAFAAGVGGADEISVLPFDWRLGEPSDFGRRIARNTSSLLIGESHIARVADPAGGAYAVERLTREMAAAAWAEFQRIEADGGIDAVLKDGSLRGRIDEAAAERGQQVATRTRPITGLTEFPNLNETLPERPDATTAYIARAYGADFEQMRDHPVDQPVFLATMGPLAAYTARVGFVSNLFAVGGIAVTVAGPTENAEAVAAAYDGQPVVCLCGSDDAYAEWGQATIDALRAQGAQHVIVAGKPGDLSVDDSCATGVDALAFLTTTREKLS